MEIYEVEAKIFMDSGFLFRFFLSFRSVASLTNIVNNLKGFGTEVVFVDKAVKTFNFWALTEFL